MRQETIKIYDKSAIFVMKLQTEKSMTYYLMKVFFFYSNLIIELKVYGTEKNKA